MATRAVLALLFVLIVSSPARAEEVRPRPDATVELDSLAPGVWIHTSYYTYPNGSRFSSNGLVVRDVEGLTLIDTAWGERLTISLLEQIERMITDPRRLSSERVAVPIRLAVVTHAHGDRSAGVDVLRERGIPVLAHPETIRRSLEVGLPPATDSLGITTEGGAVVVAGGVEVYYPGPGHSPDNVMVWIPSSNVLFGGCAVRPADASTLGNTAHADLASWPMAIERALKRYGNADVVVPGHGSVGGPELLRHTLSLLRR